MRIKVRCLLLLLYLDLPFGRLCLNFQMSARSPLHAESFKFLKRSSSSSFFFFKEWPRCWLAWNSTELKTKSTPFPTAQNKNLPYVSLWEATLLLLDFKLNSYIFKETSHFGINVWNLNTKYNKAAWAKPQFELCCCFNLGSSSTFELVSSCATILWWVSRWGQPPSRGLIRSLLEDAPYFPLLCSIFPLRGWGYLSLKIAQYRSVYSLSALLIWDGERQILHTFL